MKLIGVIAFLAIIFVGCQKEDIRPNTSTPTHQLRSTGDEGVIDDSIDNDDDSDEGNPDGNGITDPNDANKSTRTVRPRA